MHEEWPAEVLSAYPQVFAARATAQCSVCGETEKLTWHHRRRSTKKEDVSDLIFKWRHESEILDEMAKCEVLCPRCHKIVHKIEKKLNDRKSFFMYTGQLRHEGLNIEKLIALAKESPQ